MSWLTNDDVVRYLTKIGLLCAAGGPKRNVLVKAADYTILAASDPSGTIFTNRGATGTVIFTLPAPTLALAGVHYRFVAVVAAQLLTVKTATADTLIAFNDLTADNVTIGTSSEIIGGQMEVLCDGTSWIASVISNLTTPTVNT